MTPHRILAAVLLGITVAGALFVLSAEDASTTADPDLAPFFGNIEGTFVLVDPQSNRTLVHHPERARTRFLPASTFKIPNTLIALETGVAPGPDFALPWDSTAAPRQTWWPESWARETRLREALPGSVVWFYQELARRIGAERMQDFVDRFDYGNRDISGGIDHFWLTGGLQISAEEQVRFLQRFYFGELGLSTSATEMAKELLVLEETPTYRLSGKTGWAGLGEPSAPQIGWFVGYLERGAEVYFFALNLDIRDGPDAAERSSIAEAILRELALIDEGA